MTASIPWRGGNRARLLENGEAYFPRVFAAIAEARREILLETFILFEDKVGLELQRALVEAARRGVRVEVTVDGYGSPRFTPGFLSEMVAAGVRFRVFDPHPGLLGMRVNLFRRLHRKLLVIDGVRAFVGGINYSADHLADFGPTAKQDYAVELEGPVVDDILDFMRHAIAADGTGERWRHPDAKRARADAHGAHGDAEVAFVIRDNLHRADAIEDEYRRAIRAARREIVIANAYFFPGYGFLHELQQAARRGVVVSLMLQGEPDSKFAQTAARRLYRPLLEADICVLEYFERPFHGKVALIDDDWATVGSSNLDPLSLSLNLEANVFIRNRAFAGELRTRLDRLRRDHCRKVDAALLPPRRFWHPLMRPLLFHCLRRFPSWAGLLPAHTPRIEVLEPPAVERTP
jgi:cardiolipin synthase